MYDISLEDLGGALGVLDPIGPADRPCEGAWATVDSENVADHIRLLDPIPSALVLFPNLPPCVGGTAMLDEIQSVILHCPGPDIRHVVGEGCLFASRFLPFNPDERDIVRRKPIVQVHEGRKLALAC
ncbi:MAG TPA: hypothetical protein VKT99_08780 [Xanthobacteraceae bacterium]|jgi:hypothetical protein|nr:hypothetical protein [Xanthobacteraceae bacterium]